MDIMRSQQCGILLQEFDVVVPERVRDVVFFETGRVDFCFVPEPFTERLTCFVRMFDAVTEQELLGGFARVRIPRRSGEHRWLGFSGFGYYDEEMLHPVDRCMYELWTEGPGRVAVRVLG